MLLRLRLSEDDEMLKGWWERNSIFILDCFIETVKIDHSAIIVVISCTDWMVYTIVGVAVLFLLVKVDLRRIAATIWISIMQEARLGGYTSWMSWNRHLINTELTWHLNFLLCTCVHLTELEIILTKTCRLSVKISEPENFLRKYVWRIAIAIRVCFVLEASPDESLISRFMQSLYVYKKDKKKYLMIS